MKVITLLLTFFLFLLSAIANFLQSDDYPILNSAHYGVLVKSLVGNETVKAYQNDKSFTPASVMKLITTATALEKLGPDFRYMTKLEYSGKIVDGVLYGDILIKGDGDPTLGSHYFYDNPAEFLDVWVSQIATLGIDSVAGGVVSDASVFDKMVIPDKWLWEDIGNYYGSGCYGLSCFDNRFDLYFGYTNLGDLAIVDSVHPDCTKMTFDSYVTGADTNTDNAYIYGGPWSFKKQIYGTIPAGRKMFKIKGALPNPPLFLADLLAHKLEFSGISIRNTSQVLWKEEERKTRTITSWFSPSLGEIIRVTNKESNNLFAEHILKTIFQTQGVTSSIALAVDSMMMMWSSYGLKTDGVKIYDGSGMSRANLLTPDFMVNVIDYMSTSKNCDVFYSSLAISGVDGTFKYFLDDTTLHSKAHGKSGTMSGVRCYAGIIEKSAQEKYSFCIFVNNFTVSSVAVKAEIEAYLCELLR